MPTFIERKQIGVVEMKTIDHVDAYTAPRLVEVLRPARIRARRCRAGVGEDVDVFARLRRRSIGARIPRIVVSYGVTVEGELPTSASTTSSILSAQDSNGLVRWLTDNGYRIPAGAESVLASYIKQNMRFFVAKVNLGRMQLIGSKYLRPLQVRYDTPKFMLPLRLGTVNANGPQDLIIYALTRNGRVETANYRTVKLPSGMDVPLYVKDDFGRFYKAMFDRAVAAQDMRTVFTEYAWDMGWCDPCASPPLSNRELVELGARWIGNDDASSYRSSFGGSPSADAYVTRLHVRYDAAHFPEDLALIETHDRENFQSRYVLRYPWTDAAACKESARYRASLPPRFTQEAKTLADLTGWEPRDIEARMAQSGQSIR